MYEIFMKIDFDKEETRARLKGSLLSFMQFFYKYLTRRDFIVSQPLGREPLQITLCKELTALFRNQYKSPRLAINLPPGHGKTLHVCMWIAWCYTHFPDCNFIYTSYGHDLAAKHTSFIKQIMSSAMYRFLFDVSIKQDSRAKDNFTTHAGGTVAAFGSGGAITGRDAGLPNLNRFTGALILDDPIKPDDAHSDTIRNGVIRNYDETMRQRLRGLNVAILAIGQRIHERDLFGHLLAGNDIAHWNSVVLKAIDEADNALYPEVMPLETLKELEKKSRYVFAGQYQQNPVPAGGGLYRASDFVQLDKYPDITETFITIDTAETTKSFNDATVFSFWGVYEIETMGRKTGETGLHWIDCVELRIEPKDLQEMFLDFYQECCMFPVSPKLVAIEKKSTGVTLVSTLKDMRGVQIRDIPRDRSSGSKADRFVSAQSFIASKRISINKDAKHKDLCIEHMTKITANNSHRFDDIADTVVDAIDIALVKKQLGAQTVRRRRTDDILDSLRTGMLERNSLRTS